jgi:hypothetical protein
MKYPFTASLGLLSKDYIKLLSNLENLNISCPSGIARWEDLVCDTNQVEHDFM